MFFFVLFFVPFKSLSITPPIREQFPTLVLLIPQVCVLVEVWKHMRTLSFCLQRFLLARSTWATASVGCGTRYHPSGTAGRGGAWCPAGPQARHREIHPHQPQHCKSGHEYADEVRAITKRDGYLEDVIGRNRQGNERGVKKSKSEESVLKPCHVTDELFL